ncbi:unnamed protein product, partial [marine sediment metagenome]
PVEPPPLEPKYKYQHIISQAYIDILQREADAGGLNGYNELMLLQGMSEADLRNTLLRSQEFDDKFGVEIKVK